MQFVSGGGPSRAAAAGAMGEAELECRALGFVYTSVSNIITENLQNTAMQVCLFSLSLSSVKSARSVVALCAPASALVASTSSTAPSKLMQMNTLTPAVIHFLLETSVRWAQGAIYDFKSCGARV